jgi:dienelactone hydrolase
VRTQNAPEKTTPRSWAGRLAAKTALVLSLALATAGGVVAPAQAADFQRGPNPTESSITALRGPFSTTSTTVRSSVTGFGGGTIYYPTDTSQGTFGGVVVAPGYTASSSTMSWLGPRLASQGFVIFTIDTNSRYDQPDSRGRQIEAAMDYLARSSGIRALDPNRMAVMGHSMGGGGSLAAAEDRPSIKAAIPLTPWHTQKNWSRVTVPTMIIGAENDSVASTRSHAIPFYESLNRSLDRAYVELDGASHFAPNTNNTPIARNSIAWLKLFVDEDERYEQFLCPAPGTGFGSDYSDYRDTCPYGS